MFRELRFADRLCLFPDHCKQSFVKFANQNFSSVCIFVFQETTKFLFTLQARQFDYILLEKVFLYTIFLHFDSILAKVFGGFAHKPSMGGGYSVPPYALVIGTTP